MICVIPARGGSKRLKRKNLMVFRGKPLVDWTIECALQCADLFTSVYLASENMDILLRVWFRQDISHHVLSLEESSSTAGMRGAALAVLSYYPVADSVCILPPTAPLRKPEHIRACVKEFVNTPVVMAVSRYNLPPWQALVKTDEGIEPFFGARMLTKRGGEMPSLFCDAGSVYVVTREHLETGQSLYHPDMRVVEVPMWRAVDIDDIGGWQYGSVMAAGLEALGI